MNLNSNSTSKPNQSAPHAMSEFYGYDDDQAIHLSVVFMATLL